MACQLRLGISQTTSPRHYKSKRGQGWLSVCRGNLRDIEKKKMSNTLAVWRVFNQYLRWTPKCSPVTSVYLLRLPCTFPLSLTRSGLATIYILARGSNAVNTDEHKQKKKQCNAKGWWGEGGSGLMIKKDNREKCTKGTQKAQYKAQKKKWCRQKIVALSFALTFYTREKKCSSI